MSVDPPKSQAPPEDRLQLSAASSCLVDGPDGTNGVPEGAVSPERMLEVLRRLRQDYYSSAEVLEKVAQGIQRDLSLSRTE